MQIVISYAWITIVLVLMLLMLSSCAAKRQWQQTIIKDELRMITTTTTTYTEDTGFDLGTQGQGDYSLIKFDAKE